MSTAVSETPRTDRAAHTSPYRLSFLGILRAEVLKFRTLVSSWVLMIVTIALMAGMASMAAWSVNFMTSASQSVSQDPAAAEGGAEMQASLSGNVHDLAVMTPTAGATLGFIVVGAMAVMILSTEFGTKSIISTFTAAPRRWAVYVAKALVISVFSALVALISAVVSYPLTQLILSDDDAHFSFTDSGYWTCVLGLLVVFVLTSWMGLGLAALLRNSAGAIVVVVVVLFVLPLVWAFLTNLDWASDFMPYLPMNLANTLTTASDPVGDPQRVPAGWWYALWCAVPLVAGFFSFTRRDPK